MDCSPRLGRTNNKYHLKCQSSPAITGNIILLTLQSEHFYPCFADGELRLKGLRDSV